MSVSVLVGLPSVDYDAEESPVSDEEERPLSLEELRKKIIQGVSEIKSANHFSDYLWFMSQSAFLKYFVHLILWI